MAEEQSKNDVADDKAPSSQQKFSHKSASQYYDPCQEFANRSIKCLKRNGGDRQMCSDYFQAYRDCKKAWNLERKQKK